MTARVDHAVVSGTFSLDGETYVDAILDVVAGRAVKAHDRPLRELTHTDELWDVDLTDGHTGHGPDTTIGAERANL